MTQSPENQPTADLPIQIDVASVKKLLDEQASGSSNDLLLIDCRETNEFEFCSIAGAQLIPMNETPNRLDELEPHRTSRIVVHCHHGGRSFQVVQYLRSQGFDNAQNMTGGIDVWSQQINPEIPRY
jgi:rhodanese-related sulfurtransferase